MMREAHQMTKEAHGIVCANHAYVELERRKQEIASDLVAVVYERAAEQSGGSSRIGIALNDNLSPLEREAALSLKGDPRVEDVTVEAGGRIKVWVDGSGFPKMPN